MDCCMAVSSAAAMVDVSVVELVQLTAQRLDFRLDVGMDHEKVATLGVNLVALRVVG